MAGADFAGQAASQHLHTSLTQLEQARRKTRDKQVQLNATQVLSIQESSKDKTDKTNSNDSIHTDKTQTLDSQKKFLEKHRPTDSPNYSNITHGRNLVRNDENIKDQNTKSSGLEEPVADTENRPDRGATPYPGIKQLNIKSIEEDNDSVTIKFEDD